MMNISKINQTTRNNFIIPIDNYNILKVLSKKCGVLLNKRV